MVFELLTASASAAPQTSFGLKDALFPHGEPNWIGIATFVILVIMSFGSFFILITKWMEQNKIMKQYRDMRANFWRAPSLKEGAAKLEKNSAWRQIVDDGLAAEEQHGKMVNETDAHDAAQEVFVRLFLHRDKFAGRAKFTTWLHGLALRTCLTLRRTRGRRPRIRIMCSSTSS